MNDLSVKDASRTAEEKTKKSDTIPILDVHVEVYDHDDDSTVCCSGRNGFLGRLGSYDMTFYAQQLVESLAETSQDMDEFIDVLQAKKSERMPVSAQEQKAMVKPASVEQQEGEEKRPSLIQRIANRFN
ncbi:hypothetical protein Pmar_PMAR012042 [Perkinsus marinus ATCC 50983]|uniref:Uncharacterized protein n=1 Tax=Perkinsus marinus (strain ATCC 50983 / TXsc) TaxID=423536 RepID=C5LW97_PERM5|nr:hypothetical protein Pmar_PMAR012042 [Perkinsus marinus ATCC 50983]EEQ99034.1 hypothetical protein Pmar_PMAR012042 [Perkinsus marinus ATCC 50983]|eukprot:XP_002766317.1 hypothetical protein Pmar_PMAR012042 [Perkinsus marinus ATCC 50983]